MSNGFVLRSESYNANSFITIEGKPLNKNFYIIKNGKVQLSRESSSLIDTGSDILGPGDFFGVISCMSIHPRLESAVAISDVILISIMRDQFGTLIQKNAPIAMKIIKSFSKRLRTYDHELTKRTLQNVVADDPEQLYHIGEYYFKQQKFNLATYAFKKYLQCCPNGSMISTAQQRLQATGTDPSMQIVDPAMAAQSFNKNFANDTMIFCEHEPGDELYIIQQGKVKITKIVNDQEVLLAVLQPGDIFGEMALLEDKPRSASAIAFGDVTMLTVNRANFQNMVISKPQIATKLIQLLSDRIWIAHKQLENLLMRNPIGRLYDTLLTQALKQRIPIEHRSSYSFEFGTKELVNMMGLAQDKGDVLIRQLFENNKFKLIGGKIHCVDLEDLEKQVSYFKKMDEMERKRELSSQKM